MDKGERYSV